MIHKFRITYLLAGIGLTTALCAPAYAQNMPDAPKAGLNKIGHIIVIYLENRSFDNLYGMFPGANGIANAGAAATQVDANGEPYKTLPAPLNTNLKPAITDTRFPAELPNGPFAADKFAGPEQTTGDLVHRYYQEQLQINEGRMNKFVAYTDSGGLTMNGYANGEKLAMWSYAKSFVLVDNFFHAAFGGSFLNHFWLVCACTPVYANAPDKIKAQLDSTGALIKDGAVTPDGHAVNTIFSVYAPHPASITDTTMLLPPQDMPNIGDRLSEKNISWAWYSGGWNDAIAGKPDALFQFHHQPFAYFKNYGDGTPGRKEHLKDFLDFQADIIHGTLPAVSFYKPIGENNEHPGYASVSAGERHVADLIKTIQTSKIWDDAMIIVTYDENGGQWDHVAPPKRDIWGPGSRVPTLVISPFAKKGFIDHTQYDTTAILKLIETRYGLEPLGSADAAAHDMTETLELN